MISNLFEDEVAKAERGEQYTSAFNAKRAAHVMANFDSDKTFDDENQKRKGWRKVVNKQCKNEADQYSFEILCGDACQSDLNRFSQGGASKHQLEIIVVSIGFKRITPIDEWSKTDLENILDYGNSLYRQNKDRKFDCKSQEYIDYPPFQIEDREFVFTVEMARSKSENY